MSIPIIPGLNPRRKLQKSGKYLLSLHLWKDTPMGPMALKPGFWSWCPLSLFVTQCKDETDFVLIKLPILNNSLFASSCINYDQMQCMAKYNNKMQFLNSSARVAHNTAEEGPHTWIQKILRKVAKHLRHNKSFVADQYSDAAAIVRQAWQGHVWSRTKN